MNDFINNEDLQYYLSIFKDKDTQERIKKILIDDVKKHPEQKQVILDNCKLHADMMRKTEHLLN